jgi:hypothetical protein
MNGIRVYLGVYPGNAPNGKADYTTMFMVPTGRKTHSESNFNMLSLNMEAGNNNIPGGDGLNDSDPGIPPGSEYQ